MNPTDEQKQMLKQAEQDFFGSFHTEHLEQRARRDAQRDFENQFQ